MSSTNSCIAHLVPSRWCYWGVGGNFKRWDLASRNKSLRGMPLKVTLGPICLPVSLLPGSHEVTSSPAPCPSAITHTSCSPRNMEPNDHELKPPNPWIKVNLSSFKMFMPGNCHSDKTLTNTVSAHNLTMFTRLLSYWVICTLLT
jgi:hypothetical protein